MAPKFKKKYTFHWDNKHWFINHGYSAILFPLNPVDSWPFGCWGFLNLFRKPDLSQTPTCITDCLFHTRFVNNISKAGPFVFLSNFYFLLYFLSLQKVPLAVQCLKQKQGSYSGRIPLLHLCLTSNLNEFLILLSLNSSYHPLFFSS